MRIKQDKRAALIKQHLGGLGGLQMDKEGIARFLAGQKKRPAGLRSNKTRQKAALARLRAKWDEPNPDV